MKRSGKTMAQPMRCCAAIWVLAVALAPGLPLRAAEIQLRPKCQARTAIVTLGDVAEVTAVDPAQARKLAAVELFAAPASGQQRVLRVRELQDLLGERGISLAEHRLSGSNQVVVLAAGEPAAPSDDNRPSASLIRRGERIVAQAITAFLNQQVGGHHAWQVEVHLTDAQIRALPADERKVSVRGGQAPWTGIQQFQVMVDEPTQPASFVVEAHVSQLLPVVVAMRAIGRGETIGPDDVQLQRPPADSPRTDVVHTLEDVVGLEAAQSIPAGTLLQKSMVRSPLLVRRGEVITVYARASGIRVRATARARENGSLGDLITVESLADRRTYTARVCGIQEAEVYARALQASSGHANRAIATAAAETRARTHKDTTR